MNWQAEITAEFTRRQKSVDDGVVEEMAQHAAAAFEAARADGASVDDATAHVRALVRSWCEGTSGPQRIERTPLLDSAPAGRSPFSGLALDVRQSFRLLRRQPGVACLSVLMIVLGIGVTTALFTIVNSVLLRPLPWKTADRLVRVFENRSGVSLESDWAHGLTNMTYNAWNEQPQTIDGVAGWRDEELSLPGETGVQRIAVATVTPTLFPLLGEAPLMGVNFTTEDARAANTTVILSYGFWQERFGGAPDVLGKSLTVGGRSRTVIGVMRRGFHFPTPAARLWTPFESEPVFNATGPRRGYSLSVFYGLARLKPGVTSTQATAEGTARLNGATFNEPPTMVNIRQMATEIFDARGRASITAVPLLEWVVQDVKPALWILLVAGGLLFAAAIGTVVNLQLAQAVSRRREIAIRSAIGAGSGRLARQLFVETITLAFIGGTLGLALTTLLLRLLPVLLPMDFPRVEHIGVDTRVFGVAAVLTLVVALVIGLLPARMARRDVLTSALAEDGSAPLGHGMRVPAARTRGAIITAQVAIAAMLLVGASLLSRSFTSLLSADRGYQPGNMLTARVGFFGTGLPAGSRRAFYTEVIDRITAIRGVTHAAFSDSLPTVTRNWTTRVGLPSPEGTRGTEVDSVYRIVSDDYFGALGMRLLGGRGFTAQDTMTSESVVVVNETFAKRHLNGAPLGVQLSPELEQYRPGFPRYRVVGVVADVQQGTPVDPVQPELYVTIGQLNGYPAQYLTVRTEGNPGALARDVRAIVRTSRNASLDQVLTMDGRVLTSLARPRLYAVLIGGFSGFAVFIALIGLFGGLSYGVTQRTREIGVRAALGATPLNILSLVLKQGTALSFTGVVLGLGLSAMTVRSLSAFLFGITPFDPATFGVVAGVLLAAALVACAIPARRAARIDALTALRM